MTSLTRSTLERDLREVQDDLLRMGSLLDNAIALALQALSERNRPLARQIVQGDALINALRFKVEEACVVLIATQQPAARDLRAAIATMIIAGELERIADYAAGVAKTVLRMDDEPLLKPLVDLPRMADKCRTMVRLALDAYVNRDDALARRVAAQDDDLDALYNQIFRELLSFIIEDPRTTSRALYLLFSAHNMERIGDRAVNVAERVIFLTSGEMKELNAGAAAPLG